MGCHFLLQGISWGFFVCLFLSFNFYWSVVDNVVLASGVQQSESVIHVHMYAAAAAAKSLQWCPTLCDPIDGSPPGSPVPGILQARILEWVAISSAVHESEK